MQNRYTGDIGDFGKIGLLRCFEREFTLGVNWYLTSDGTRNGDGRHGYLQKNEFRLCDQQLWTELKRIVDLDKRRVSELERPEILQAKFYRQVLDFRGVSKNAGILKKGGERNGAEEPDRKAEQAGAGRAS